MDLQQRWHNLWSRHSSDKNLGEHILADMISKYSQIHRHYHTLVHVSYLLTFFDNIKNHIKDPDKVEFAIWFHDVIYNIGAKDNEKESAKYAVTCLTKGGIDEGFAMDVHNYIVYTEHKIKPKEHDAQYLVDMDLLSLAGDYKDFKRRGADVRAESNASDEAYHKGTSAFFQFLINRGSIFWTAYFHNRYEKQAKENLLRFMQEKPN